MKELATEYMGLKLPTPLIVSSSPLTASAPQIAELAAHGAGAVVLKSIFEEQISGETAMLDRYHDYPEAADYLRAYVHEDNLNRYTALIAEAKRRCDIPVIASINCSSRGKWTDYAVKMAEAGADALELNIFFLPTDRTLPSTEIEARYLDIIEAVARQVTIPVSVKFSMRFTNIFHMIQEAYNRGARGAVLYNRFFEPDIDIDSMSYVPAGDLSSPSELHRSLRYVAIASAEIPHMDYSVSTGVHSGKDAIKSILAGANAVQLCSTILIHGMKVMGEINAEISAWMEQNSFERIDDFRGLMNRKVRPGDPLLERVQYMKTFPAEL